jgi:hypothetical protein
MSGSARSREGNERCKAGEDIATALGTGTAELRPALMKLKSLGAVEPKGKARATTYYAQGITS